MIDKFNLHFITHSNDKYLYIEGVEEALKGGCKWIQVRMKDVPDNDYMDTTFRFGF